MEGVADEPSPTPAVRKPALLRGGLILCWIYAALLVFVIVAFQVLPMAAVSSSANLNAVGGAVVLTASTRYSLIPLLLISIALAYGLAKDKNWSRPVMLMLLTLGVIGLPLWPELATPAMWISSLALLIFGWWYLYRKPNVVEYYASLRAKERN